MKTTTTAAKKTALRVIRNETTTTPPSAPARDSGRYRRVNLSKIGVVEQVRVAFQAQNRLATIAGFLLGGFVPVATYLVSHYEVDGARPWYAQLVSVLILGGLCYSAQTVYGWARLAFANPYKAVGFCVLIEGVMTFSSNHTLGIAALCYLVVINGVATGTRLALQ